jgi:hypothetical protein
MHPHASASDESTTGPAGTEPPPPQPDAPIVVRSGEDLVAAVPHLVGFAPERSLVVVSMRRRGTRLRLGLVARFDLPPVGRGRARGYEGTAADVRAFVSQVVGVLRGDAPEQVVVLVYDQAPCSLVPVWQRLVSRLDRAFAAVGVPVVDALHVSGSRFRSYRCSDPGCCPPLGRPLDARSSAVTAEFVTRGSSPLPNRRALEALVEPRDQQACTAVRRAAGHELAAIGPHRGDEQQPAWLDWQVASLLLMHEVALRHLQGRQGLACQESGRLLAGLSDVGVRDAASIAFTCWMHPLRDTEGEEGRPRTLELDGVVDAAGPRVRQILAALGDQVGRPWEQPATGERNRALGDLWRHLAVSCDGSLAVPPLTLLGMHAWWQGEGALAQVAVERALRLDPGYRMANLLDQALSLGLPPWGGGDAGGGCP